MRFLALANAERTFSYIGIILGATVSFLLAPKDQFFLPNFFFYWGSQLAVVASIFLLRPRPAIVAALSFVLATILLGFRIWVAVRSRSNPDGLVWFLYLVLLFGAAIGGYGATWWCRGKSHFTPLQTACIAGVAAIGGSCLSATWACNTAFYCH